MTRSVEELRRESERSRAELAATVDQLRARISDTAEDIRHKVSPQHIKSEVSDYISHKTQSWVEALKQQAMENPMQAIRGGHRSRGPGAAPGTWFFAAAPDDWRRPRPDLEDSARPRRGGGGSRDGQGEGNAG
jgi:Protein of unknown function (DUF3618)